MITIKISGRKTVKTLKKEFKTAFDARTEKQNDILVAKRQKYNGMAWSPKGSLAITLVTASYY